MRVDPGSVISASLPVLLAAMPAMAPAQQASSESAAIVVEGQRSSEDQRIQSQVMERLAAEPHLTGRISVESHEAIVTLGGWTSTVGQARRAEQVARRVIGVKHVDNQIRPQAGGSV